MVTFTSRARLIKPTESGEVVDVSQINANMDKIDANLGVFYCTSTTRPTDPFPGQAIRESDTGRSFVRNSTNTGWDESQSVGYSHSYSPGFTGNITGTDNSATQIHRFYFGPTTSDGLDLLIQGVFFMQFQAASSSGVQIEGNVLSSDDTSSSMADDLVVAYKEMDSATVGFLRDALPFTYLLTSDNANRYLKLSARRGNTSVSVEWQNGPGLSYALAVTPVNKTNGPTAVIPGFAVQV